MTSRRFPAPWSVEPILAAYRVLDASGQALAYDYTHETKAEPDVAKALTFDEARRGRINEGPYSGPREFFSMGLGVGRSSRKWLLPAINRSLSFAQCLCLSNCCI